MKDEIMSLVEEFGEFTLVLHPVSNNTLQC
jgi:hypothetical protein